MNSVLPAGFWERILFLLNQYGVSLLRGAGTTLLVAVVSTAIGCVIGFLVGILQTIPINPGDPWPKRAFLHLLRILMKVYVEVFRGTPMMVQAMFIYYGASYLFGINMTMMFAAFFIVSINTGAYMAETVRGGILSVDPGQNEGAKAIGMTHGQTMSNVILPQALRSIMPQIGNNFIINLKDTSVMFIIGYTEFFATHKAVVGATFLYFPSATIEMAGYLFMTLVSSILLRWWEKRMDGSASYDLATTDTLAHTSGMVRFPKNTVSDSQSERGR